MLASTNSRTRVSDTEHIASLITQQQHLFPHRPIRATVRRLADQCGLSEDAAEDAVEAVFPDGERAAGRLSRAEIVSFARHLASTLPRTRTSTPTVLEHHDARAA